MIAYDPFLTPERAVDLGVEKVELDELLARADFITLHTPLTDQTRNILSRENLAKTKQGVRIINCARGGLIDEAALKEALESGHVAGAALDVFVEEPAKANPLFGTPGPDRDAASRRLDHRGAGQRRDPGRRADVGLPDPRRRHQRAQHALAVGRGGAASCGPIWSWPRSSARWSASSRGSGSPASRSRSRAPPPQLNQKPITGAVLAGLMRVYSDTVNMVNAPFLAKERGLDVREVRHDREGDYHTLVRVTVTTPDGRRARSPAPCSAMPRRGWSTCSGSRSRPSSSGEMIYIVNEDAPGFIGRLGTTLGEAGVNIGTFHLGRREAGGEAVALVSVDGHVERERGRGGSRPCPASRRSSRCASDCWTPPARLSLLERSRGQFQRGSIESWRTSP